MPSTWPARRSRPCRLGRIDEETTANIGVIQGGTATNIVPDEVFIRGEARSRNDEKLAKQTAAMVAAFEDAAERNGAHVEVKIQRSYNSYTLTEATPVVAKAMAAIQKLGQTPALKASGGGTDGNIYAEHGIYLLRHQHGHEPGAHDQREYRHLRHGGGRAAVAGYRGERLKVEGPRLKG